MRSGNISVSSLVLLFLFALVVGDEGCSPSSCGQIQSIRYPFRLKGDPIHCGDPNYELTCSNNKTFLEISSGKYLVTNISYEDHTIQIVSVGLTTGNCSHFLPPPATKRYYDLFGYLVTFVNCSKMIQNDMYRPVPCLSHNIRFVYVVLGPTVGDIVPFCSFLSTASMPYDIFSGEVDVFRVMQEGFTLTWPQSPNRITRLKHHISICLHRAKMNNSWKDRKRHSILRRFLYPFQIEQDTVKCLRTRLLGDTDMLLPLPPKPFSFSSEPVSLRQSCIHSSTAELSIISETSDSPSLQSAHIY